MNYVLDKLPSAVRIDGRAVPINTDFRICLRILRAFDDDDLLDHEKLSVMLTLLYPTIPDNTASAVAQGLKFLNCGKAADAARLKQLQVYSLEKDSCYIFTAFKSIFNIDLENTEYLHWWKFRSLFADLGKDCFFNTLVSLRSRRNSGKLTKDEKEFVQRNADIISLSDDRRDRAVQDFVSKIGRRTPNATG